MLHKLLETYNGALDFSDHTDDALASYCNTSHDGKQVNWHGVLENTRGDEQSAHLSVVQPDQCLWYHLDSSFKSDISGVQ